MKNNKTNEGMGPKRSERIEQFIQVVQGKTKNSVHLQLLAAYQGANPAASMDAELKRIIDQILYET